MSADRNANLVRESLLAAFSCDWEQLADTYAEDAVMTGASLDVRGREAMVSLWRGCHEEERQLDVEILSVTASEDVAAIEFRHKGIVNQPLPGVPEELLGKQLEATEVHVCKIHGGRITSVTIYGGTCQSPDLPLKRIWVKE